VYDVPYFSQFTTDFAIIFGERVKEATKFIYKHTKRSPPEECAAELLSDHFFVICFRFETYVCCFTRRLLNVTLTSRWTWHKSTWGLRALLIASALSLGRAGTGSY
jgi:hypothetical protein